MHFALWFIFLFQVRDVQDKVVGETEIGWAIGEIQKVDPAFDINLFLEDMEEYMIPVVVKAYLDPNIPLLKECTEGQVCSLCLSRALPRTLT